MTPLKATSTKIKYKFGLLPDGTLGYQNLGLFDNLHYRVDNVWRAAHYKAYVTPYPELGYKQDTTTHIDWLRATVTGKDKLFLVDDLQDILTWGDDGHLDTDFHFATSDKGLHGYPEQTRISVVTDAGLVSVGGIAYERNPNSSNCGVMVDFTGQFFAYLRERCPSKFKSLFDFFTGYEWRITRIDLALDLDGDYCRKKGYTVPTLGHLAHNGGLFSSEYSRGSTSLGISQIGDWSGMLYGDRTPEQYDPAEHSPKGLTINAGSRKSPNFFRIYEKSKQLISMADLGDDHDLDKWAVRIEHEVKRDKDGAPIPFEMMLDPDAFFGLSRPVLTDLFQEYRVYLGDDVPLMRAHRDRFKRHALLSIKAKAAWAKRSYGRLLQTLYDQGLTKEQVFDQLTRTSGLKDFAFDLFDMPATSFGYAEQEEFLADCADEQWAFYEQMGASLDRGYDDLEDYYL